MQEKEQEQTQNKSASQLFNRLFFSRMLEEKNAAKKIAFIALMTAFCVVANMLEIKLGSVQFSLTIFISGLTGMVIGGGAGFCACFLGDLIGFFLHPFGEYSPFIGISTALMALFIGWAFYLFEQPQKGIYLKLGVACLLIFIVCTCGITTLYLNLVWKKSMTFWEYLPFRLFVEGQIYNSLVNSALVVLGLPALSKLKILKILP